MELAVTFVTSLMELLGTNTCYAEVIVQSKVANRTQSKLTISDLLLSEWTSLD